MLGTETTEAKIIDTVWRHVCLHRIELTAKEEVILRQPFMYVTHLSLSYLVDIVDGTFRQE